MIKKLANCTKKPATKLNKGNRCSSVSKLEYGKRQEYNLKVKLDYSVTTNKSRDKNKKKETHKILKQRDIKDNFIEEFFKQTFDKKFKDKNLSSVNNAPFPKPNLSRNLNKSDFSNKNLFKNKLVYNSLNKSKSSKVLSKSTGSNNDLPEKKEEISKSPEKEYNISPQKEYIKKIPLPNKSRKNAHNNKYSVKSQRTYNQSPSKLLYQDNFNFDNSSYYYNFDSKSNLSHGLKSLTRQNSQGNISNYSGPGLNLNKSNSCKS